MVAHTILSGWQLGTVIIASIVVGGFLLVLIIIREGRSRRVRVGVFIERETLAEPFEEEDHPSEWPTAH